jgi:hypothetical protein|tara:strand:+ start:144 stop:704 length:561 start_codon:yes stop_codon:yes gene_type:complete
MATSNFIQSVKDETKGKDRSVKWYRAKIKEFGKPVAMDLIRDGKRNKKQFYGKLNMFFYDPKFKKELPYYDTFPLVLPIERYTDGFLGVNFHYLPIPLRIKLLDRIMTFANSQDLDESSTRIIADYSKLKKINIIKPTLHKYLHSRVKSQFRRVDADEFKIACLLPVQRFKKSSSATVWKDSRSMI